MWSLSLLPDLFSCLSMHAVVKEEETEDGAY